MTKDIEQIVERIGQLRPETLSWDTEYLIREWADKRDQYIAPDGDFYTSVGTELGGTVVELDAILTALFRDVERIQSAYTKAVSESDALRLDRDKWKGFASDMLEATMEFMDEMKKRGIFVGEWQEEYRVISEAYAALKGQAE